MTHQPKFFALVFLSLAAGCSRVRPGNATQAGAELKSGMWIARIVPIGNQQGLRGDIRLTPTYPGETRAVFDVRSIAPRARHPWVIRTGRCEETNARDLSPRAVPPIEGDLDGMSRLTVNTKVELTPGNDYHIAIAASPSSPDTYVACAALVPVS